MTEIAQSTSDDAVIETDISELNYLEDDTVEREREIILSLYVSTKILGPFSNESNQISRVQCLRHGGIGGHLNRNLEPSPVTLDTKSRRVGGILTSATMIFRNLNMSLGYRFEIFFFFQIKL